MKRPALHERKSELEPATILIKLCVLFGYMVALHQRLSCNFSRFAMAWSDDALQLKHPYVLPEIY
jgi:hypothetical protein